MAFLIQQDERILSAAALVEAQAVVSGRTTGDPFDVLDTLLRALHVDIVPLSVSQADLARRAYLQYGEGSGHPASLNFGDVMSYALAADRNDTLAFVVDDFHHTDLRVARLPPT